MKNASRLLIAAVLLLALRFLATRYRVPEDHDPEDNASPQFDHDPMSIKMTGGDTSVGVTYKRPWYARPLTCNCDGKSFEDLPLNSTKIKNNVMIYVKVPVKETLDAGTKVMELKFKQAYPATSSSNDSKDLVSGVDYTIDNQYAQIIDGIAAFKVMFQNTALNDENGSPNPDNLQKIHIIAVTVDVTQGSNGNVYTENKHRCFQTITVHT